MKNPSVPWRAGVRSSVVLAAVGRGRRLAADARGPRLPPGQRGKVRMVRQEPGHLVAILLRQHRAGGIDEPAAGFDHRRRRLEDGALLGLALGQVGGFQPPLGIRPPPPGAAARAGRVDEHAVESGAERGHRRRVAGLQHLDIARAGPLETLEDRPQASRIVVVGVDLAGVAHGGGEGQRLAAGACTNIEHLLAGPAAAISAASCEPSSCTSYQPRPCPISASTLGCRPGPSGAGNLTPTGDKGVGSGPNRASAFSTLSRSALRVLTRRSTGARRASAAPSSAAASPNARASDGSSQSGKVAAHRSRRIGGHRARQACLLGLAQRLHGMPRAVGAGDRPRPARAPAPAGRQPGRSPGACRCPSGRPATGGGAARRRRGCRWPPDPRSPRSDGSCPSRPARWPPGGAG